MSIIYNVATVRAKLVRGDRKLLTIPCQQPRKVKSYYIAFRMLQDDVQALVDFLRTVDAEDLSNLASSVTPPANMFYQSELGAVIDRFARGRQDRDRSRQRQCCTMA